MSIYIKVDTYLIYLATGSRNLYSNFDAMLILTANMTANQVFLQKNGWYLGSFSTKVTTVSSVIE